MTLGWLWWPAWLQVDAVVAAHLAISTFTLHGRRGDWRHGPALCMALGDIDRHFVWQAWHWATWTCPLRGRRGTYWHWVASGGALGSRLAPWSPRLFAWQAWRLATSTFTLRGKRGTLRHGSSLCVAGVAPMTLRWLVARLGPVWRRGRRGRLRGRRGTWRHRPSLCVAGVALGDMDRHFAWQPVAPRHLLHGTGRGVWWHQPSVCVAGVWRPWRLVASHVSFAWQA